MFQQALRRLQFGLAITTMSFVPAVFLFLGCGRGSTSVDESEIIKALVDGGATADFPEFELVSTKDQGSTWLVRVQSKSEDAESRVYCVDKKTRDIERVHDASEQTRILSLAPLTVPVTKSELRNMLLEISFQGKGEPDTLEDAALIEEKLKTLVGKTELPYGPAPGKPGFRTVLFHCSDGTVRLQVICFFHDDTLLLAIDKVTEGQLEHD